MFTVRYVLAHFRLSLYQESMHLRKPQITVSRARHQNLNVSQVLHSNIQAVCAI